MQFATRCHAFEPCRRYRRDVGVGIAFEQLAQHRVELLGPVLGNVSQRVQEHKLGHNLAQRIALLHDGVIIVHGLVVVGHICLICSIIQLALTAVHLAQILNIIRVAQRHTDGRIGKVVKNQLTIHLGIRRAILAHIHQIHIIICVEAILVVGVIIEQAGELCGRCVEVLQPVLENHAHVVQPFLNHLVSGLPLLISCGDLGQVVLRVVRVGSAFRGLGGAVGRCLLGGGAFLGGRFAIGGRIEIVGVELLLVAAAPVILQAACAPLALEFGLARVLGGGIVEVPRVVGVDVELRRCRRAALLLRLRRFGVGQMLGTACRLGLLTLLLVEVLDYLVDNHHLLLAREGGQMQQRVLQLHILGVYRQLVEHIGAPFQQCDVGVVVGQLADGLGITRLRQVVAPLSKVQLAEGDLRDGFINAVAR